MKNAVKVGMLLVIFALIGGTGYLAAAQLWRPVMPEVFVDVRVADQKAKAPTLMLVYGEQGSDPFRGGHLKADQRISHCVTIGSRCVSTAARKEFGTIDKRLQSLQIRLLNGKGNPIVGGLRWTGAWHPAQIRVECDLRVSDVQKSCAIAGVEA